MQKEIKKALAKDVANQPKKKVDLNHLVRELDNIVVQKYIEKPCLINGKKFDIRAYLVVICCKPYFVYAHDGYARISLMDYTTANFGPQTEPVGEMTGT